MIIAPLLQFYKDEYYTKKVSQKQIDSITEKYHSIKLRSRYISSILFLLIYK